MNRKVLKNSSLLKIEKLQRQQYAKRFEENWDRLRAIFKILCSKSVLVVFCFGYYEHRWSFLQYALNCSIWFLNLIDLVWKTWSTCSGRPGNLFFSTRSTRCQITAIFYLCVCIVYKCDFEIAHITMQWLQFNSITLNQSNHWTRLICFSRLENTQYDASNGVGDDGDFGNSPPMSGSPGLWTGDRKPNQEDSTGD